MASTTTATRRARRPASSIWRPAAPSPGRRAAWRCSAIPSWSCAWAAGGFPASPGPGPLTFAETADGEPVRVLSEAAIRGLALAGVEAEEAHALLLGRADLSDAPGVNHAALLARGFTDHEIAAVEAALPLVARLPDAFAPAVIGEGFLRDVMGASAEQLADPQLRPPGPDGLHRRRRRRRRGPCAGRRQPGARPNS